MQLKHFISSVFIFLFGLTTLAQNMNNVDFEATAPGSYTSANAVSGWTVSSQTVSSCASSTLWTPGSQEFSVVATPVFSVPLIGILSPSPFGGTHIAQLNDYSASTTLTKIEHNIAVTATNNLYQLAIACVFQDGGHMCCEQPKFEIVVKDCSGNVIPSLAILLNPAGVNCGIFTPNLSYDYLSPFMYAYSDWQIYSLNLAAYVGSCVTMEIITKDCISNCHFGTTFVDARCGNHLMPNLPGPMLNPPTSVYYCANDLYAVIEAPIGYSSYSWIGPNGTNNIYSPINRTITIYSPQVNAVYTVNLTSASGTTTSLTYTLVPSSLSVVALGSTASCLINSNGSATIIASGGGPSYGYLWTNSSGQFVGNSSIASNLSPGVYNVIVNSNCGSVSATVSVGSTTTSATNYVIQPYCQNQSAYLSVSTGSNYQWYDNTTAIAANMGGTSQNYTVISGIQGAVYPVSYLNPNGCKDSVRFYLNPTAPGSLSIISNSTICQNSNNGVITVSLNPSANSPGASISYSLLSLPSLSSFSTAAASAITVYTFNSLQAGTNYSLLTFDGFCSYSNTLTPDIYITPNFGMFSSAYSLCPGQYALTQATFPNQWPSIQAQLSFTWTPAMFLSSTNSFASQITPTLMPGTSVTIVYTLTAENPSYNCPASSNTLAITAFNNAFQTPTISPVPNFCKNSLNFTVSAIPSGGFYYTWFGTTTTNVINPGLYPTGAHSFLYGFSNYCGSALSSAFFTIHPLPNLSVSGNTFICIGETTTLSMSGANSYTWNTGATGSISVSTPSINTNFTITGESSASCINTISTSIVVNSLPTVTTLGNRTICKGSSTTLTAVGANYYYNWSTGSTANTIVLSPSVTTTYTLLGGNSSLCTDTEIITITVETCDPTYLNELKNADLLILYPNPAQHNFFIETAIATNILITDVLGSLILETHLNPGKHSLDLSNQSNGIYFLKGVTGNSSKTIKLIKN